MALSRSENMARIRGRDTGPEVVLRRALWAAGLRYRKHAKTPVGRPDVVFPGPRVAVFIDGCFWHGCPAHYSRPNSQAEFWAAKLVDNVTRDRRQTLELEALGWRVVRVWEHEVYEQRDAVVARVAAALRGEPTEAEDPWRVVAVDPAPELGERFETRSLSLLREPERVRYETGPRVTAKWKRPKG